MIFFIMVASKLFLPAPTPFHYLSCDTRKEVSRGSVTLNVELHRNPGH